MSRESTNIEFGCGAYRRHTSKVYRAGYAAACEACGAITIQPPKLVVVLATPDMKPYSRLLKGVAAGVKQCVGEKVPIIGGTVAPLIGPGKRITRHGVTVTVVASEYMSVTAGMGGGFFSDCRGAVRRALAPIRKRPQTAKSRARKAVIAILPGYGPRVMIEAKPGQRHGIRQYLDWKAVGLLREKLPEQTQAFGITSVGNDKEREEACQFFGTRAVRRAVVLGFVDTDLTLSASMECGMEGTGTVLQLTTLGNETSQIITQLSGDDATSELQSRRHGARGRPQRVLLGATDTDGSIFTVFPYQEIPNGPIAVQRPVSRFSNLTILKATKSKLVAAAQHAFQGAMLRGGVKDPAGILAAACTARLPLLGSSHGRRSNAEVDALGASGGVTLFGGYGNGEHGISGRSGAVESGSMNISVLVFGNDVCPMAREREEREKLGISGKMIARCLQADVGSSVERFLSEVLRSLDASAGHIRVLDRDRGVLVLKAKQGLPFEPRQELRLGEPTGGQVAKTKQPIVVNDADGDKLARVLRAAYKGQPGYVRMKEFKSFACFPILLGADVIATLNIEAKAPRFFTDRRLEWISALTSSFAVAIEHTRTRESLALETQRLGLINSLAIDWLRVPQISYKKIVTEIANLLDAEDCLLFTITRARRLRLEASKALPESVKDRVGRFVSCRQRAGLTSWVAATGRTLSFRGGEHVRHPAWARTTDHLEHYASKGCRSLLLAPMRGRNRRIVGVLKVENRASDPDAGFTEEHQKALELLAALLGSFIGSRQEAMEHEEEAALRTELSSAVTHRLGHVIKDVTKSLGAFKETHEISEGNLSPLFQSMETVKRLQKRIGFFPGGGVRLRSGMRARGFLHEVVRQRVPRDRQEEVAVKVARNVTIYGDMDWLIEALGILVENALEAKTKRSKVWLSHTRLEAPHWIDRLSVSNRGRPLTRAQLATLGRQKQPVIPGRDGHAGVGLLVANAIARAHGGELTLENVPRGVRATLVVPMAAPTREASGPVLLIDDNVALARALAAKLRRRRFHVNVAHDAVTARHLFREYPPQTVVSDLSLPRKTGGAVHERHGWRLLEELRKASQETGMSPCILVMSNAPPGDLTVRAHALRVTEFILKPLDTSALAGRIARAIRNARERARTLEGE